jgi:hypothetical protein
MVNTVYQENTGSAGAAAATFIHSFIHLFSVDLLQDMEIVIL